MLLVYNQYFGFIEIECNRNGAVCAPWVLRVTGLLSMCLYICVHITELEFHFTNWIIRDV